MLARLEIVRGQHFVQAGLGEIAAVRFAAPGHHAGNAARAFPSGACSDDAGTDVVDDQTAAGRTDLGEVAKRRVDGGTGEIRSDPQPDDQACPGRVEPAIEKPFAQYVMFEIEWHPDCLVATVRR